MVGRRDFLKASTLVGVGAGAMGCAGRNDGLLVVPSGALTAQDMESYLARLDQSMHTIATLESPVPKLFPGSEFKKTDPIIKDGEALLRKNMRSLMLVGSFHDLPEEARAYPGMQDRLWDSMTEMDEAMTGMHNAMKALTPTERTEIGRALRSDPDLGMRIIGAIDNEAATFGVPMERRLHLRSMAAQVCSRLKQSSPLFIDEYVTKTGKIMARSTKAEDMQRHLIATLGEQEFFSMRERHAQYVERWRVAQANADPTSTDGSWITQPSPQTRKQKVGKWLMVGGAIGLGLGLIIFGTAALIITFHSIPIMIMGTAGAVMGIGGLVVLIVGAALYSRSP